MYMSKEIKEKFRPGDLVSSVAYDDFTRHNAGLGIIAETTECNEWPVIVRWYTPDGRIVIRQEKFETLKMLKQ